MKEIREIFRQELESYFGSVVSVKQQPMSIADQAINLARHGRYDESKALLKAHSKRRAK